MRRWFAGSFALLIAGLALLVGARAQIALPWPGPGAATGVVAIGTPVTLGCAIGGAAATTVTITTSAAIPAGSTVYGGVIAPFAIAQTVTGVSDGTNTYTQAVHSAWDATSSVTVDTWYKANAAAVSTSASLVFTFSSTTLGVGTAPVACAAYVTGVITAPLDKTNSGKTANTTAYASGSTGTLTQANEIAFGFIGEYNTNSTITEGSGFTGINTGTQGSGNFFQAHLAYQIVAATTALNYQPATSGNTYGSALIATLKGN